VIETARLGFGQAAPFVDPASPLIEHCCIACAGG
jgi:hypothetical protein